MLIAIVWITLAVVLGLAAKGSGRSFWIWFILGMIIDPILAWIVYVIVVKSQ